MSVVPIARDRCFFYRKFLLTLGPCLACCHSSVLLYVVSYTPATVLSARPLEKLLYFLN